MIITIEVSQGAQTLDISALNVLSKNRGCIPMKTCRRLRNRPLELSMSKNIAASSCLVVYLHSETSTHVWLKKKT